MTDPTHLIATNSGIDVLLTWIASDHADGYNVYRGNTLIGVVTTTSFLDTGTVPGAVYTWKVIAFGACGFSGPAVVTSTVGCGPPVNVTGISVSQPDSEHLFVQWTAEPRVAGYKLERSTNGGLFTSIITTDLTSYTDGSVSVGSTYQYRVRSYNFCADGNPIVSDIIHPGCSELTPPPSNIRLTPLSQTQIQIAFDEVVNNLGHAATTYTIQRRLGSSGVWVTVVVITNYADVPYTDGGLSSNTEYCYRISAAGVNCIDTNYSEDQCVRTLPPLPCNSPENTFEWSVPRQGEPGIALGPVGGIPVSDTFLHISPSGSIDMSDPRIVKMSFGPGSDLDDLLILMKDTDSITQIWDGTHPHPVTFRFPANAIFFANTFGFYISNSHGAQLGTALKILDGVDAGGTVVRELIFPNGNNDIAKFQYDAGGNILMTLVGLQGSPSCLAHNGLHTLVKQSNTLWVESSTGWRCEIAGSPGNSNYLWEIKHNGTLAYSADANVDSSPPTETWKWLRKGNTTTIGCQASDGPNGMGFQSLIDAGFMVRSFASGVTKADLIAQGLIDENGTFNFKFAHIICGYGHVVIKGLTCSDGIDDSTSCSSPLAPTNLNASVSGGNVTLSWTDHSAGTAQTVIEILDDIEDEWTLVQLVGPGVTSYTDTVLAGNYVYRVYARNDCGQSSYSNYVPISVPCACVDSAPPPPSIRVKFIDITGCACFPTGLGGSTKTVITMFEGPYTLTGDGIHPTWTGLAGFVSIACHSSTNCSDTSPVLNSGPVNITVSIAGGVLTIEASLNSPCCGAPDPTIFRATQTISCLGGLFAMPNDAQTQDDCACSGVGAAYGGEGRVEIICGTDPCVTDDYTVTFNGLVPYTGCLSCGWRVTSLQSFQTVYGCGVKQVTPSIFSATPTVPGTSPTSWFDSGANFPAGSYTISYCGGAMTDKASVGNFTARNYFVYYNDGSNNVEFPIPAAYYDTQAQVEAAFAGRKITISHVGGKIGVRYFDVFYSDNVSGSPNPTFGLTRGVNVCTHSNNLAITSPGCKPGTPQNAVKMSVGGSLHSVCNDGEIDQTLPFPGDQFKVDLAYDAPNDRYAGSIEVEDTNGFGDNLYDDGYWNIVTERCGDSLRYESDSVDGQTFTLSRTADPNVFAYETLDSPVLVRYYSGSPNCTGGYLLPIKFGIYLTYDQVNGGNATLTAIAYVGATIETAHKIYLFKNTAGVPVVSNSFILPNEPTEYVCDDSGAIIMIGGTAVVRQTCAGDSSSSSSIPPEICAGDGSGVTLCGSVKMIEVAGAKILVTVSDVQTVCTVNSCVASSVQTAPYKAIKVLSLNPNQQFSLTFKDATLGWRGVMPCSILLYPNADCTGTPLEVTKLNIWFRTSTRSFHIESDDIPGFGKVQVFSGSVSSTPPACPLTIANFYASTAACGSLGGTIVAGGGNVKVGGCAPGICPGTCNGCCQLYTVVVSGSSGTNNVSGTYLLDLAAGGCAWSSSGGDEYAFIAPVNDVWQLVVGNAKGRVAWYAKCSACPPTNPANWRLQYNSFAGTPVFTIATSLCPQSSSSSSGPPGTGCNFQVAAAGGDEGFIGSYVLDHSLFSVTPRRFYFTMNTYGVKDRMIVTRSSDGHVFYDSGCIATAGDSTVAIDLVESDSPIQVEVIPNCEGTRNTGWNFSINCRPRTNLGDMTVTYDWTSNPRTDLDTQTVFNLKSPASGGAGCGPNPQTYLTFSGSAAGNGTETAVVKVGSAYYDGIWSGSTTVDLHACWNNAANGGNNTDPWTFKVSVTWRAVTQMFNLTSQALNTGCCSNKVCTITAFEDGTFALSCDEGCTYLAPPVGLAASYVNVNGTNTVSISWSAVVGATGYDVERSYDNTTWSPINGSVSGTTATDVTATIVGTQHLYYRVRTLTACGSGNWSAVKQIVAAQNPQALTAKGYVSPIQSPTNSAAQGVTLTWTDPSAYSSINVYRNASPIATGLAGNTTTYNNPAAASTTYTYAVRGITADGYAESSLSYTTCSAETVSNIVSQSPAPDEVTLQWDFTNVSGGSISFEVFVSIDSFTYVYNQTVSTNSATVTGLSAHTMYWFAARAIMIEGDHQCRAGLLDYDPDGQLTGG
jgi:hypothetical protein